MVISIQQDDGTEIDAITLEEQGLGIEIGSTIGSYRLTYETTFVLCKMLVDAGLKPASKPIPVDPKKMNGVIPFKKK